MKGFSASRRSRGAVVVTVVAALLAGCGGSESPTASGATREVTDVTGAAVTVPDHPERVVTLSEPTLDAALALGVTPVGTVTGRGQGTVPAYLAEQAGQIEIVGSVAQPNLETIKGLDPDLILVDGTSINNNQPLLDTLGQIAPVVNTGKAGGDWKANLALTADALNQGDAGQKLIDDYNARIEDVSSRLGPNAGATISIVRWQGKGASLILKELIPGRIVTDLGLKRPPSQDREGRGHSEPLSNENIADIDADWVFVGSLGGASVSNPDAGGQVGAAASQQAIRDAAISTPGFMELSAFQNQRMIGVDGSVWTSTGGPILVNRVLDDLEKNLAAP